MAPKLVDRSARNIYILYRIYHTLFLQSCTTDRQDISEILLKVVIKTTTLTLTLLSSASKTIKYINIRKIVLNFKT